MTRRPANISSRDTADEDTADQGYYDEETGDTSSRTAAARPLWARMRKPCSPSGLLVNSDNAFKAAAADQIAASWNALDGVQVTVVKQPYETFLSMLQSGDFGRVLRRNPADRGL